MLSRIHMLTSLLKVVFEKIQLSNEIYIYIQRERERERERERKKVSGDSSWNKFSRVFRAIFVQNTTYPLKVKDSLHFFFI